MLKKGKKINLLIVAQDVAGLGGAEKLLTNLTREFVKKGVKVKTVTNYSAFLKEQKEAGSKVKLVPSRVDIIGGVKGFVKFFFQLPWAIFWYSSVLKEFKKAGGNLVLISGFSEKIIASPLAKILDLPVVWIEYASLKSLFSRNFYIPRVFYVLVRNIPELVVAITAQTRKRLIDELGFKPSKVEIIHCGIEILEDRKIKRIKKNALKVRKELGIKKDENVVGIVSRLQEQKGQDTLIESTPFILKVLPRTKFLIVGEGGYEKRLKELSENLGVNKSVYFLGYREDLYEILSVFDIFVFPSRWELEGFGIAPVEAMMMEIPVVASNLGPVPEVISDAGKLISPDKKELAKVIIELLRDEKLRKKLGEKGRKRARSFDSRHIAEKYLVQFRKVLEDE